MIGSGRPESMSSNIWGDGSSNSSSSAARTSEMIDTFDFFVKSKYLPQLACYFVEFESIVIYLEFRPM